MFGRFQAVWTPTILVLSPKGQERSRVEGYLPRDEFVAELKMALGRVQVMQKAWPEAEKWFAQVAADRDRFCAAAARYWQGVCQYSASHDPAPLRQTAEDLRREYPRSSWAAKASVWLPQPADEMRKAGT